MPEYNPNLSPAFHHPRRRIWLGVLLILGLYPSVIPFVVLTLETLDRYRAEVRHYNKFEIRPDQMHLAAFNQDIPLDIQGNLTCAGSTSGIHLI